MKAKKKLAAIFTTLLMIISFFAVLPSPVHAQVAAVTCLDMAIKDPGTGVVYPGPFTPGGLPPMNVTLTNIKNASMMGNVLIMAIMLLDFGGGISLDNYTFGLTYTTGVLKVTGSDPTTYGVYTTGAPLGLFPTVFELTGQVTNPGVVNTYAGYVANYSVSSTAGPIALAPGAAVYLGYITFVMNYWGKAIVDFTVTPTPTQTTVLNLGVPHALAPLDGNYEFSVHKVETSAGFDAYWGEAPGENFVGENLTATVTIKNTEAIHSWEINITYFPSVLSVPSSLLVVEGPYFKVVELPTGINDTFIPTVDNVAGWIHVNCTALPGKNRTGDGLLMAFVGYAAGYGTTPFLITHFNAVDNSGASVSADLETVSGGFKYQQAPIVAIIDTGTTLPLMKSWTTAAHSIGETFLAAVSVVQTSEQVVSWKAGFTFNPRVLQINWIVDNVGLGKYIANSTTTPGGWDNVNGVVPSWTQTADPGNSSSGSGALLYVNFTVLDYGVSEMDMTDANVTYRTELHDGTNPIQTPSGLVFVTPDYTEFEFRAPVELSFVPTPGLNPRILKWIPGGKTAAYPYIGLRKGLVLNVTSGSIQVNITISSMENITGYEVGLRFDKNRLSCTNVQLGGFINASVGQVQKSYGYIDNAAGIVAAYGCWFNYSAVDWVKGNGLLLTVDFNVLAAGDAIIYLTTVDGDLAETAIMDRDGEENTQSLVDTSGQARYWGDVTNTSAVNDPTLSDVGKLDLAFSGFPQGPLVDPWCAFLNGDWRISLSDVGKLDLVFSGFAPYPIP